EEPEVHLISYAPAGRNSAPVQAVLVDTESRATHELEARDPRHAPASAESLTQTILESDTLILVLDGSFSVTQLDIHLIELSRFLRELQQRRGQAASVGGFPVFLALARCDLLAEGKDSSAVWLERVAAHRRAADYRLHALLAGDHVGPLAFGGVRLR